MARYFHQYNEKALSVHFINCASVYIGWIRLNFQLNGKNKIKIRENRNVEKMLNRIVAIHFWKQTKSVKMVRLLQQYNFLGHEIFHHIFYGSFFVTESRMESILRMIKEMDMMMNREKRHCITKELMLWRQKSAECAPSRMQSAFRRMLIFFLLLLLLNRMLFFASCSI